MKVRSAISARTIETLSGASAGSVQSALARMHANDRQMVASGAIKASSLHLIPAADARKAKVRWTVASTVRFKG